jgi:hypothetical protein
MEQFRNVGEGENESVQHYLETVKFHLDLPKFLFEAQMEVSVSLPIFLDVGFSH